MSSRTEQATAAVAEDRDDVEEESEQQQQQQDEEQDDTRDERDIILEELLEVLSATRREKTLQAFNSAIDSVKSIFAPYASSKDLYATLMNAEWPKSRYADLVSESTDAIVDLILETIPVIRKKSIVKGEGENRVRRSLREEVTDLASAHAAEATARINADPLLPIRPWVDGGWDIVPNRIEEWKRQGRVDSRRDLPNFETQERIVSVDEAVLWMQWQIISPASTLVVAISEALDLEGLPITDASLKETAESIRDLGEGVYADIESVIGDKLNEWSSGNDAVFEFRDRVVAQQDESTAADQGGDAEQQDAATTLEGETVPVPGTSSGEDDGTVTTTTAATGGAGTLEGAATTTTTSGQRPIAVASNVDATAKVASSSTKKLPGKAASFKSTWSNVGSGKKVGDAIVADDANAYVATPAEAEESPAAVAEVCLNCNKAQRDKFVCSKCGDALYCSKWCQRQHWHSAHRNECARLIKK